jgi:hypothetical protein
MTRIFCHKFRPDVRGHRIGFAELELQDAGLVIKECGVHENGDSRWISWPGTRIGEHGWACHIRLSDTTDRDAFQQAALAAIDICAKRSAP